MFLSQELGRHTPPPPPYSLSTRDTARIRLASETSQRPPPPPPPPYLRSAPRSDCKIPSIHEVWRQAVASDGSYLFRNGNGIPLPPVPSQHFPPPIFDSQQGFVDYRGSSGMPAHPVEPKWTPVGILGYSGPPLGGATVPLPKTPLESLRRSMPQGFAFTAGTRIGPDHEGSTTQSPSALSLSPNAAPRASQPPGYTITTINKPNQKQKPLPTFRKQSSKETASLANIITTDVTAPFEPSNTICPLSALPSQQTPEKLAALAAVSRAKELNTVKNASNFKSPQGANEESSSAGDSSDVECVIDKDGQSTPARAVSKSQDLTSPAGSKHGPQPSKERMDYQSRDGARRASHPGQRKPSASARFMPYQRRQSNAAE
ncbi:MAG: hypothetical protein ALECFALPRED_004160 [Alectoria fallacina]|uniref:Uncharacterized protein n=1 Tax=Alectoria fallacina TaxID=1903189 RepID=A0A8H3FQC5_9LECA|nr:MAG: hypothetical protein ALECFALPRED_004160 [Alectoria fallacina]